MRKSNAMPTPLIRFNAANYVVFEVRRNNR